MPVIAIWRKTLRRLVGVAKLGDSALDAARRAASTQKGPTLMMALHNRSSATLLVARFTVVRD
jgi:hypothetical protein